MLNRDMKEVSVTSSDSFMLCSPSTKLVIFVMSQTIKKNYESRNKNNYCICKRPFQKTEYERTYCKVLDLSVKDFSLTFDC